MTRIYKEGTNALEKIEIEKVDNSTIIEERTWIEVTDSTQESLEAISKKTNIPLHFLMSSLDEEESARIDNENGSVLIVLDVPCLSSPNSDSYITQPFIIAYNEKYYVTINRFSETLLPNLFKYNQRSSLEPHKPVRLSLNIIYQMSKEFIYYLRKIDAHTKDIELRLHTSMKNKELFELLDINKTLVYFSTSLSANKAVLMKLLKSANYVKYDADKDLMEDTEVELNQAIEMCSIYREILTGMMDAFGTIISNNLNIVMKTLAVITIVISVPTLVASIYGMNVELPLEHQNWAFYVIMAIALIAAILAGIFLYYSTKHNRNKD